MNLKAAPVCRVKTMTSELLAGKNGRMFLPRHLSCKELSALRESYKKGSICAAKIIGIYRHNHSNDKDLRSFLPEFPDNETLTNVNPEAKSDRTPVTALICLPFGRNLPVATLLDRIGGGENFDQQRLNADMDAFKLAENNLALIKKEYEITLSLHGRLLELADPDKKNIFKEKEALNKAISHGGIKRAAEINVFIEKNNLMPASAIMSARMRYLKEWETKLFSQYYVLSKKVRGDNKIKFEPDGNITIFMGRHIMVEDTTVKQQKPQTYSLYHWHRILDKIFVSLAENRNNMEMIIGELKEMSQASDDQLVTFNKRLTELAGQLKHVKAEDMKQLRLELELTSQFVSMPNWKNMARAGLRSALDCIAARIADIDSEVAHLEYLRVRLRGVGAARLNQLGDLSRKIRWAVNSGKYGIAVNQAMRTIQFLSHFRNDPDFDVAMGAALRMKDYSIQLVKKDPPISEEKKHRLTIYSLKDIGILDSVAQEGLLCGRFMAAYQALVNNMYLGKIKNLNSNAEVFNKVFKYWFAHVRKETPQGERYWRAKLYRAVFISNRSRCFAAAGLMLLILEIEKFANLRPHLIQKEHNAIEVLLFNGKYSRASEIPEEERSTFLADLCSAAVIDFHLYVGPQDELRHFYRAFGVEHDIKGEKQ
jgi:hypothetical protein